MRIIFSLILVITIGVLSVITFSQLNKIISPCESPINYRIGNIDPRFQITHAEFFSASQEAAALWNNAYPTNMLVFDPDGNLTVNLIFDERQSQLFVIDDLGESVTITEESIDFENDLFEQEAADFQRRADILNEKIRKWNEQGGAPPNVFQQLVVEQQVLDQEAQQLNVKAANLNKSVEIHNLKIEELNEAVSTLNETLEDKPEGGIFKGEENRIEIYVNNDREDLIRILAHEMGHAIGIVHVKNPNSIMFPESNDQSALTQEDIVALRKVCEGDKVIDLILMKLQ